MLSATILSAALAVAEIQAPPAAGFSFRYEDLQPIGSQGNGAVALYVLPSTRRAGPKGTVGIVTVVHNREEHRGAALFTVFNCDQHTFQIQVVGRIGNADGKLAVAEFEQPGEGDAAMSPTKDSPWGEAVEQAACGKGA